MRGKVGVTPRFMVGAFVVSNHVAPPQVPIGTRGHVVEVSPGAYTTRYRVELEAPVDGLESIWLIEEALVPAMLAQMLSL